MGPRQNSLLGHLLLASAVGIATAPLMPGVFDDLPARSIQQIKIAPVSVVEEQLGRESAVRESILRELRNDTADDLIIEGVRTDCGCVVVQQCERLLPAHSRTHFVTARRLDGRIDLETIYSVHFQYARPEESLQQVSYFLNSAELLQLKDRKK